MLGLLVALAWWWLAPTAPVGQLPGGTLVAPSDPELAASQDGVLVVAGVVAGLLCAAAALVRPGAAPLRRSLLVLLGCALGSVLAERLGGLLGPAPVAAQRAADADPVLSPLQAHSASVLLVWPLVAALALTAGHLSAAWAAEPRADPADPDPADPDPADPDPADPDPVPAVPSP